MSNQTPYSADPCQTPKASAGRPSSAADPSLKNRARLLLAASARISANFRQTFRRSKIHQKSDPSKSHPKSQKSDPQVPKGRFWSHFCTLFSPIFDAFPQNINFLKTCIFPRQEPNIEDPDASNVHQKYIPKSCFFEMHSWIPYFCILC